jgi:hypothetical protein
VDGVDGHLGVFGDGVVVAFEGGEGRGVGADDGDGVVLGGREREDAVVLEEDHGLFAGLEREGEVLGRAILRVGDAGVGDGGGRVE